MPAEEFLLYEDVVKDGEEGTAAVEASLELLQQGALYWRAKQAVKEELLKPQYDSTLLVAGDDAFAVREAILSSLRARGLDAELKSQAYLQLRKARREQRRLRRIAPPLSLPMPPLPVALNQVTTLDAVDWARWRWAYLVLARLRELSREQQQPFLRPRVPPGDRDSQEVEEEGFARPIIELSVLYDLLTTELRARTRSGCMVAGGSAATAKVTGGLGRGDVSEGGWSVLGVQFLAEVAPSALRKRFRDLVEPLAGHLGVPEPNRGSGEAEILERRLQEARELLTPPGDGSPPALHRFARCGVPPSVRRTLWARCLLEADSGGGTRAMLQEVAKGVCEWEWLTDDVLRFDVVEHCASDACYFPFDEITEAMVLALSRDPALQNDCECGPPQIPIEAGAEPPGKGFVPPCGVVPFRGFSCYASPFAFFSDRLEVVYPLFRAFYCRYLSRLHTISCEPGTLLPLCGLFEALVFSRIPHVCLHLAQIGEAAAPLRAAFPWIVRGFVGFLRVDQVFWLWDRVLGFDSTEPIALLAAAIFVFRGRLLLSARSVEDVELAFADIKELHAIPLLQHFLLAGAFPAG